MNYLKNLSILFILLSVLFSCQKELSIENGGTTGGNVKTNCKIQKLIEADASSGNAEYAYISTYDAANKASNIELVDSTVNSVDNSFPITYPAGKVQVDANQFFVVGTDGKVTQFHGYEFPDDNTSEMFTAKYTYNASAQLVKRTAEYDTLPGVVAYQVDYSYSGSNLVKAEISFNLGTSLAKVAEVVYEYDATKTVKSFLVLHALASELFYFQTAVNTGSNSTNPIKKATVSVLDFSTGGVNTYISNFVNYSIDANNNVANFEVTGDDFDVAGLYSGKKYILNYSCL